MQKRLGRRIPRAAQRQISRAIHLRRLIVHRVLHALRVRRLADEGRDRALERGDVGRGAVVAGARECDRRRARVAEVLAEAVVADFLAGLDLGSAPAGAVGEGDDGAVEGGSGDGRHRLRDGGCGRHGLVGVCAVGAARVLGSAGAGECEDMKGMRV